jgi:hypothetical protein
VRAGIGERESLGVREIEIAIAIEIERYISLQNENDCAQLMLNFQALRYR